MEYILCFRIAISLYIPSWQACAEYFCPGAPLLSLASLQPVGCFTKQYTPPSFLDLAMQFPFRLGPFVRKSMQLHSNSNTQSIS